MSEIPERLTPQIYSDDTTLIDVLLERHEFFDIYWFHWPHDGPLPIQDFEPVIISYCKDNSVCSVIVRRAWRFTTTLTEELIFPLRIIFDGPFHHPVVVTSQEHHNGLSSDSSLPYQARLVPPEQVPDMFRRGLFHMTNVNPINFWNQEDPANFANRQLLSVCA